MEGDDMIEFMFDTFHDHRNGYRFRVNALGTLRDQLINDEGRVVNDQAPIRLLVAAGGAMVMVGGAGRLVLRT